MALVAISYPIEGLALLGWLAQVLEKVLSKSLVELPLQLIGILVFDWQGTASRKAVPPNPHPDFLVCNVCWIELLPCFPLLPSCLGEPMIAPLSRRVIALAKKVDKSTFTSITTPVSDLEIMCEQVGLIVKNLKVLLKRYPPFLPTILLYQVGHHTYGESWLQGTLWPPPHRVHPYLPSPFDYGIPLVTGRLGQTIEGGGKRRIFVMSNYVNLNQRLLKPVHDWLMQVLRKKSLLS
ncbi:hypothetical protein HN51_056649 [Arachis hypogaea]